MKVSVSTYIAYTYEADIDLDPTEDLDKFVWRCDFADPAFTKLSQVLTDRGIRQFDADICTICDAETGEVIYEGV